MKSKLKIFFIFQDLSKTGAPIIFNNYLKIAQTHTEFDITIFGLAIEQPLASVISTE